MLRRILISALVCGAGTAAVVGLAPGGLGTPRVELVTGGLTARGYHAVTTTVESAPDWLAGTGEHLALAGLVAGLLLGAAATIALVTVVAPAAERLTGTVRGASPAGRRTSGRG